MGFCVPLKIPNLFFLSTSQGINTYNYTHMLDVMARHIKFIVGRMQETGFDTVEASPVAVDAWVEKILEAAQGFAAAQADCTPGFYNFEGQLASGDLSQIFYAGGPHEIFKILDAWREQGDFEGLELGNASG